MDKKTKVKKRSVSKAEERRQTAETVDKAIVAKIRPGEVIGTTASGQDIKQGAYGHAVYPKHKSPTQELDADRSREEQRKATLQELAGGIKVGIDRIDVQLRSIMLSISRQVGNLGTEDITPDELGQLQNVQGQIRAAVNLLRATGQNAIEFHNNVGPLQVCEPWANKHATPHRMCTLR